MAALPGLRRGDTNAPAIAIAGRAAGLIADPAPLAATEPEQQQVLARSAWLRALVTRAGRVARVLGAA